MLYLYASKRKLCPVIKQETYALWFDIHNQPLFIDVARGLIWCVVIKESHYDLFLDQSISFALTYTFYHQIYSSYFSIRCYMYIGDKRG